MKSLRRMLGITETAPKASAEPLLDLPATLDARKRAHESLAAAKAATQRVNTIIIRADADEAAAQAARAAAAASTRAWVERGARTDEPTSDQTLTAKALAAEQKASASRLAAEGAIAGLRSIRDAEQNAQYALDASESAVQEQVAKMLLDQVENDFAVIEYARAGIAESHARIQSLAHTLRYGQLHGLPNTGGTDLLRRLNELQPRTLGESELREQSKLWIDFARRLSSAPDG